MASGEDAYNRAQQDSQSAGNPFPEITELEQIAAQTQEIYESYIKQDFSPAQALYLTAAMVNGNPGIAPRG